MIAHPPRHVAVIDIGKTNVKLALVDLTARTEVAALRRPNTIRTDGPYPHYDIDALWTFMLDGLTALAREHAVDAISVTTHGATAALIDANGELVLPVLDYEHDGPDTLRSEYGAVRPPFSETGSPALPIGLNLAAQLFWLKRSFPEAFGKTHAILLYPQYWARRLTGVEASEATSLGCHTDLWNPHARDFSSLVDRMGWRKLFPPMQQADAVVGPVLPEITARTGLNPVTPVVCGIHDSNASLLPHLIGRKPPFAVVSTGTWVIAMAVGGREVALDPARDTLINVNAFGDPVPSARFMGGREFEQIMGGASRQWRESDLEAVLTSGAMLMPSIQQGAGPYPGQSGLWSGGEPKDSQRFVAASFYLAMMTATCLELAGAEGETIVEGPFAANHPYVSMLAAATGRAVVRQEVEDTGTSIGAALLAGGVAASPASDDHAEEVTLETWRDYARRWKLLVQERTGCRNLRT
jgi:sugar (pentulose or hexulose) kinase